jgi:hypothetical protein
MGGRQPTAWLKKAFVGVEEEMIRPKGVVDGSLLGGTLEAAPAQNGGRGMSGTAVQGDLDDDITDRTSCLSPQGCKRCRATNCCFASREPFEDRQKHMT